MGLNGRQVRPLPGPVSRLVTPEVRFRAICGGARPSVPSRTHITVTDPLTGDRSGSYLTAGPPGTGGNNAMGDQRSGQFDHLFAGPVRAELGGSPYGAWRSIQANDAVQLRFGFPYPDSFPTEDLCAATEAVLTEEGDRVMQYGGGKHASRLPEIVVERATARGIDCGPGQVRLTNGATDGLTSVCDAFLDPGDLLICGEPTFMGALSVFRASGAAVEGVPVDEDGINVAELSTRLAARRSAGRTTPKLVYVVPTFQNPTGVTLSLTRRKRLLELATEYDFLIIEDDAYGALRYDGEPVPPLAALDDTGRVVRLGTFSKTIGPGIRTGWVIAHEDLLTGLRLVSAGGTNTFTQSVVARFVDDGLLAENIQRLRAGYRERRDHALTCLSEHLPDGATWSNPDGGFFVWVHLPHGIDAADLLPAAVDEGVVYLPGHRFFPGDGGDNSLRLSFSYVGREDLDRGIAALGRTIRDAIADE